jgi:YD repeat-containing protein
VTQFGYDRFGNQTSIIRDIGPGRLNQLTTIGYSAVGDPISITDPRATTTTNAYDAARRRTTTTAPNRLLTAYSYDPDGHVIQSQQSINGTVLRSTSATYTLTGKPATTTDGNNNTTSFSYDLLDRVSSVKDAMVPRSAKVCFAPASPRTQTASFAGSSLGRWSWRSG